MIVRALALFLFLFAVVGWRATAVRKAQQATRPNGRQLRYEALGHYNGQVRMIHPIGREIMIDRALVPQMRAQGWLLRPDKYQAPE